MSQADVQNLLMTVQNTEREARRDLSNASEEMAALQLKHSREIDDLERQISRKERERRNLEEELKERTEDLGRERETIRELKVGTPIHARQPFDPMQRSMAEQSTQHLTLSAQLAASQAQQSALQFEIERVTLFASSMKAELEVGRQRASEVELRAESRVKDVENEANRRVAESEEEQRKGEMIRRKLHNQVQELKGVSSLQVLGQSLCDLRQYTGLRSSSASTS